MTASPDNTRRSFKMLGRAIADGAPHDQLMMLADSAYKCAVSLMSQVEFYEGAKSPFRSFVVEGRTVSGIGLAALRLSGTNHVLFGQSEAIDHLETLLAKPNERKTLFRDEAPPCPT